MQTSTGIVVTNQISILLHWNLDYAEFPRSEAENMVNMSYRPMLEQLQLHDLGPVLMNITGHTIDYLNENHEDLIEIIIDLHHAGKIEIVGSAYSHPILPLLPKSRRLEQIKSHKDQLKEVFGVTPRGFWPPEQAISPIIINEIIDAGYDWIYSDHEHLAIAQEYHNDLDPFSKRVATITETLVNAFWAKWWQMPLRYWKAYRVANQWVDRYTNPLITVKNLDKEIKLVQTSVAWTNISIFSLQHTPPFFTEKKLIKMIQSSELELLPLYASDIEFFGYRSHTGNAPLPDDLIELLLNLKKMGIELESPSMMDQAFIPDSRAITSGSWAPDKSLRIWTDSEDNRELTRRITEIYQLFENQYETLEDKTRDQITKLLRIAENSDARGWAPINERKQEAFTAIDKLYQILKP